jgi:hypothetical protein
MSCIGTKAFIHFYFPTLLMLKGTTQGTGFYGATQPECFMTDDSDAEKAALKKVFPSSNRLLCHFHVLQVRQQLTRGVQSLYIFDFRQNRSSASHETPESSTSRFSCTGHISIFLMNFFIFFVMLNGGRERIEIHSFHFYM